MEFDEYSESLTRDFATLNNDPEKQKMSRQKVKVFMNVIIIVDTELIACKATISQNYASDLTGACSRLQDQIAEASSLRHRGTNDGYHKSVSAMVVAAVIEVVVAECLAAMMVL